MRSIKSMLSVVLTLFMAASIFVVPPATVSAAAALPTFTGPGAVAEPVNYTTDNMLQAIYDEDLRTGDGTSFFMDRMLARPGDDLSYGTNGGMMSRGRAFYMEYHDPSIIGFGGGSAYIAPDEASKGDMKAGPPAYNIVFSTGGFIENVSTRVDYPSYWTSEYNGNGLKVTVRKFITNNNSAVTLMDIQNTSDSVKNFDVTASAQLATTANGNELSGQYNAPFNNTTVYPKLSGDEMTAINGKLTRMLTLAAGQTTSMKVIMGFITPEIPESADEYETFKSYDNDTAFKEHVRAYNAWWTDNVPYIDVPDPYLKKMAYYRWWIVRFNILDANSTNYKYPTYMEGVLGYNNSIPVSIPWQLEEGRYLRDPLYNYGTWLLAGWAAKGGNFTDNPGNPQWRMDHSFQYISKAGWESYKVYGGQSSFLNLVAKYGENDMEANKARRDSNNNNVLEDQYDAWDGDTVANYFAASQDKVDATSAVWASAQAVAEMYAYGGNNDKAAFLQSKADDFRNALLNILWDPNSKQFLNKTLNGTFNPWRDINNYYVFQQGMIPVDKPDYKEALKPWADNNQFVTPFPAYVSNLQDFNAAIAQGKHPTRNFAPAISAVTLSIFAKAIKQYQSSYITADMYKNLLYWHTWSMYVDGNSDYPDANEYFSDWDGSNMWRSWIHHNFHSTYNTRLIEDVFGLVPRTDISIELDPMDIGWDHFAVNHIRYHNRDLSIVWTKPGSDARYDGVPEGLSLYIDGTRVATVDKLAHFVWNAQTGSVTVLSGTATVDYNTSFGGLLNAGEVSFTSGRVAEMLADALQEANPEVIDLSHDGTASLGFGDLVNEVKRYQTFNANKNSHLRSIYVKVKKTGGTGQSDLKAELYATDGKMPIGAPLASGSVSANAISNEYSVINIPLAYSGLKDNEKYAIVLSQESPSSSRYTWAVKEVSPTQRFGKWNGSVWVDEAGAGDGWLKVYARATNESSKNAAVTSTRYKVDDSNMTISYVNDHALDDFLNAIQPAPGASIMVVTNDSVTPATDIKNGYRVIVTAEDNATSKIYTVRADFSIINFASDGNANLDFGTTLGGQVKRYQTFIARVDYPNLSGVDLKLTNANARENATVELYAIGGNGLPTGEPLAYAELNKSDVVSGVIVHADLNYQGLIGGNKYAIVMGQKKVSSDGNDYHWYSSANTSNPDWWKPDAQNPHVKQDGQNVSSGKYDGSQWVDESHVGTFWLKLYASSLATKKDLADKITQAQGLHEPDYSTVTWTALQTALDAAIVVNNNTSASQGEVDAALSRLQTAIDGLEPSEIPDLSVIDLSHDGDASLDFGTMKGEQVKRYQTFIARDGYTNLSGIDVKIINKSARDHAIAELYAVNEDGLPDGEALALTTIDRELVGDNATIVHADLHYAGLAAGQKYAIVLGQAMIDEGSNDYHWISSAHTSNPDWWKPDAQNPRVTQDGQVLSSGKFDGSIWIEESHVGDYWLKIYTKAHVDKTALSNKIHEAQGLLEVDYTASSWAVLQNSLIAAMAVYDNANAELSNVEEALTGLQAAIDGLERILQKTAAPEASLMPGKYTGARSISLQSLTVGAAVYYTTDDKDPLEDGVLYTDPLSLSYGENTIKAVARKQGMLDSDVVVFHYTISAEDIQSPIIQIPTPPAAQVNNGVISTPVSLGGDGTVTAIIKAEDIRTALRQSVSGRIGIQMAVPEDVNEVKLDIPIYQSETNRTIQSIRIDAGWVCITIERTLLDLVGGTTEANLSVSLKKTDAATGLTANMQTLLADGSLLDLNLSVDGEAVNSFNGREVRVAIPYSRKASQNVKQIVVYRIGDNGEFTRMKNSIFNPETGSVEFSANATGKYAVAYVDVFFKDLNGVEWALEKIYALAARGIVQGVGGERFNPGATVTRAEFVQMLLNTLDVTDAMDATLSSTFNDVSEEEWYAHAVAYAQKLGIVTGRSDGTFGAKDPISRQEMAVMVYRAIQYMKIRTLGSESAAAFKDHYAISDYAKEAVEAIQKAGIVNGFPDGFYKPQGLVTRSQAATVVYQLFDLLNWR